MAAMAGYPADVPEVGTVGQSKRPGRLPPAPGCRCSSPGRSSEYATPKTTHQCAQGGLNCTKLISAPNLDGFQSPKWLKSWVVWVLFLFGRCTKLILNLERGWGPFFCWRGCPLCRNARANKQGSHISRQNGQTQGVIQRYTAVISSYL